MEKKTLVLLFILVAVIAVYGILTQQILQVLLLIACVTIFSLLLGYVWYIISVLKVHLAELDGRNQLILATMIILAAILISPLILMGFMIFLLLLWRLPAICTEK